MTIGFDERTRTSIAERYLRFAAETAGASPLYEKLARGVPSSEPILAFIASLPEAKRQPNLVFAAVRRLCGTPPDLAQLAKILELRGDDIRELISKRGTQTNEPGRCAPLLPVLARLPQPLALLEVGASAGLCLLLDRYGYDFGRRRLAPSRPDAPTFPCLANAATPLPDRVPEIAWRAGLDLNPLDPASEDDVAWLEALVWPGQENRASRLRAALRLAAESPPPVMKGDLLKDFAALAATAPADATLVVFHSATLSYLEPPEREAFVRAVRDSGATWISNEGNGVLPEVEAKLAHPLPPNTFVVAVDGQPVALAKPHGQSMEWLVQ